MKRITNIFFSLILAVSISLSAYGAPAIDEGTSSYNAGEFILNGTANPGELLMLRAIKPDCDETLPSSIFYAEIAYADADGKFSFDFGINSGATGNYKMIVTSGDSTESDAYTIFAVNIAELEEAVRRINSAGSAPALKNVFDTFDAAFKISLDTTIYDKLVPGGDTSKTFDLVFDKLYAQKQTLPLYYNGSYIEGMADFQRVFNEFSALAYLNQQNTLAALEQYNTPSLYNLAGTIQGSIGSYVSDINAVKTAVAANDYTSIAALRTAYEQKLFLAAIKDNDRYQISNIVNAAGVAGLLGGSFELAKYNSSSKVAADLAVAGKSFATTADFVETFNKAIPQSTNPKPGPGGGSSGGSSVSVGAGTPAAPPYVDKSFYDLTGYEWAKEAIEALQGMNIISGTAQNVFSPERTVTREEFVKMLVLLAGKYNPSAVPGFGDVPPSHWAASYIASAVSAGLVQGIDANSFGLGYEISRQDACVLLARAVSHMESFDDGLGFTDKDDISAYAAEAVSFLSSLGIINGMDDGSFAPLDSMTRAQAAKVLYEIYKIGGFTDEN